MVCHHLEPLAVDIKSQKFSEINRNQNENTTDIQWVYFDCYLDRKSIRQKYNFPDFVIDHIDQTMDGVPEEGLICENCKCGIIGVQKGFLPGNKIFGYDTKGQIHVFSFKNNNETKEPSDPATRAKPIQEKKRWPGLPSIIFAIFLGVPIALYQYFPGNEDMLGFIAGICSLIVIPLILSPITQFIRGKDRYSFPFAGIFIVLLIGAPQFVLYGWDAVYYVIACYAGLSFFFSILLRLFKKKR